MARTAGKRPCCANCQQFLSLAQAILKPHSGGFEHQTRLGAFFILFFGYSALSVESRHCEEHSDAAIHKLLIYLRQWIVSLTLAMTNFRVCYGKQATTANAYIACFSGSRPPNMPGQLTFLYQKYPYGGSCIALVYGCAHLNWRCRACQYHGAHLRCACLPQRLCGAV